MSRIQIKPDMLEQIGTICHWATSAVEEAEMTLHTTYSEMSGTNYEFYGLPQWSGAVDETRIALEKVGQIRERITVLESLLHSVKKEYDDIERYHIQLLEQISAQISSVNDLMQGVTAPDYPIGIIEGEEYSRAKELEQSLTNTVVGIELANLSAIRKAVKEEYPYEKVIPMGELAI